MSQLDTVRRLAQQILTVSASNGDPDNSLWDHAQRLVLNVEYISRLPELANSGLQIDRFSLTTAAYFCDAALAGYADAHNAAAPLALADVNPDNLREFSTQIVAEKLADTLPGPKIDKINKIILESGNHLTEMTEAMILSDAHSIDDMGVVGIFNESRRYVIHGRGVSDALKSWKRKIDYRYWNARLKESFHFQSVRNLAAQRFTTAEHFMNQLSVENSAKDLEELLAKTSPEINAT